MKDQNEFILESKKFNQLENLKSSKSIDLVKPLTSPQNSGFDPSLLKELCKTKAHIGRSTWVKMMSPFLLGSRNNIFIFQLELTIMCMKQVLKVLENIRKKNGHILFVNTSPKYSELVKRTALSVNQSYVNDRWVGGSLTNWKQISKSIFLFQKFSFQFENFLKIHNIQIPIYQKAKKRYEGLIRKADIFQSKKYKKESSNQNEPALISCTKLGFEADSAYSGSLPDLIILINPDQNQIVIQEAKIYQIPIIGFADTNTQNKDIDYIIPGNIKSISFMYFCLNLFTIVLQRKNSA